MLAAVWSFWTPPYLASREGSWAHDWFHWLAWGLSVHTAARSYPDTRLVTDTPGAHLLVDRLGLPFGDVSTALDGLQGADPGWWALGKLEAYRRQEAPFIHLDTDVFLWRPLPEAVARAPVFAQNPEPIVPGMTCYLPELLEAALGEAGLLPEEWRWYRAQPSPWRAECCGIFGGARPDFIRHYAGLAIGMLQDPANRRRLAGLGDKPSHMILPEQFLLTACVEYHRGRTGSPFRDIDIGYLFPDLMTAYRPEAARDAGFTHLAAGAKRNPIACRHLEARVRAELPAYYARCCDVFGRTPPARRHDLMPMPFDG